ncbi:MAG: MFS transporter [Chloroflexi bacterium]|nr:MFS transporter [Chloroflexota bacterium]
MRRTVWLLSPVLCLVLLPSNVVATALPLLRADWSASATEMGIVLAAYQAGYVASVLLILPATDRIRATRVIAACTGLSALSFLLFPVLARDVWSAAALRVLAGIGLAGVYLPGVRVVADVAGERRRGLAVSIYVSAFYLGAALSLWATGALLPLGGWQQAALELGAIAVVALPLALLADRGATAPPGTAARLKLGVLRSSSLLRTILAYAGHSFELYVSRGWLAAYLAAILASNGASPVEAASDGGQTAALMAGLGTVGVWLGGWLSDRRGRANTALAIALTSGALSLVFGWLAAAPWSLVVGLGCLYGVMTAADSSIYSTSVTELAPPGQLGSAQAAQAFIGFTATMYAPVAAGAVLDLGGGFGGAFTMAGLVGLLGATALAPLARRAPAAPARQPDAW